MKVARFIGTGSWLIMIRLRAQADEVDSLLDGYLTGTGISTFNGSVLSMMSTCYYLSLYLTGT